MLTRQSGWCRDFFHADAAYDLLIHLEWVPARWLHERVQPKRVHQHARSLHAARGHQMTSQIGHGSSVEGCAGQRVGARRRVGRLCNDARRRHFHALALCDRFPVHRHGQWAWVRGCATVVAAGGRGAARCGAMGRKGHARTRPCPRLPRPPPASALRLCATEVDNAAHVIECGKGDVELLVACAGDVGDRAGHGGRGQRRAPFLLASAASGIARSMCVLEQTPVAHKEMLVNAASWTRADRAGVSACPSRPLVTPTPPRPASPTPRCSAPRRAPPGSPTFVVIASARRSERPRSYRSASTF